MPSFTPTRDYLLQLTAELIDAHRIGGPFLEIGCGDGAISVALAKRGWKGVAMDLSRESEEATREHLRRESLQDSVRVLRGDFLECEFDHQFQVIILYDVLEHVARDLDFLRKIRASLLDGGFLLLSVPVKMKEWRWDDDGYGHLRRYEDDQLQAMLDTPGCGFEKLVQWDITFPVLWMLRRVYMAVRSPAKTVAGMSVDQRTEQSAFVNAGGKSLLVRVAERMPVWPLVYWLQDRFRERNFGCNTLILARATQVRAVPGGEPGPAS